MDYKLWVECTGSLAKALGEDIEYVPVSELSSYIDEDILKNVDIQDGEPYYYIRTLNKMTSDEIRVRRVIIRIKDTTMLDSYIKEKDDAIQDMFNRVHSAEIETLKNPKGNYGLYPEHINPDLVLLEQYSPLIVDKRYELTEKEMNILTAALMNVVKEADILERVMPEKDMHQLYKIMFDYGFYINKCSLIKPYVFGEYLDPEKEWFPTYLMMPTALY